MTARQDFEQPAGGLRLLVLTELFLPTKGGTAVWFNEVYRRLGNRSTHILTRAVPGGAEHDRDHPNTVHRLRLENSRWLRPAALPKYVNLFVHGLRLAATRRFDAIHAGRVLPEGLVAVRVARLVGTPVAIYAHGEEITTWRRSPRRLRAMTAAYLAADLVIANSEFTRSQLLALGVPEQRIRIVYPGVDTERFRPGYETADLRAGLGLTSGQPLLLSVGRLSRRKGFDQLIRATARLAAEGIDLHYALIGIGEDRDYLRELATTQGIVNRIHFLGHVEMGDLPRWYNACDVLAMPNREIDGDTEGFGMVFLEAAACGKAAIAGRAGGTGDAVVDGVTGMRVDGEDLDAIAGTLHELLTTAGLAAALGARARERALREFDWSSVAAKTAALGEMLPACRGRR